MESRSALELNLYQRALKSTAIHQQGRAKGCPAHIQRIVRNRYRLKDIEALQIPPCYSPHLRVLGNTLQLRSLNHTALG